MTTARTDNPDELSAGLDTQIAFAERWAHDAEVARGRDELVAVTSLHDEFPALPVRIIAAVVAAFRPSNSTADELVPAARQRLLDALAA